MSNNISIRNLDPQEITINSEGVIYGITNVYQNGVDVTVGTKAYVVVPTKTSDLVNDSGFITSAEETDPTVPYYVKEITLADINAWNDKQDLLVSGTTIKTVNGESLLGSGNLDVGDGYTAGYGIDITDDTISNTITSYNDLTDRPTLITSTSQLYNDSGYITKNVDDLTNYLNNEFLEKLLPVSEDSGSELYLEDTATLPLRIDLNPSEITQHTTTGKNLFDGIFRQGNQSSLTTGNRIINANNFLFNSGTSYTISTDLSNDYKFAITLNTQELPTANVNFYDSGWITSGTATFTPSQNGYIGILVCTSNGTDNLTPNDIDSYKWQIEEGNSPTTYEEYTGGAASPNPAYPQELHTTIGDNTINVISKNLLNVKDNLTSGLSNGLTYTFSDNKLKVSGTTTNTWSYATTLINDKYEKGTFTLSIQEALTHNIYVALTYTDGTSENKIISAGNTSLTFTTTKDISALRLILSALTNNTEYNEEIKPMLERGSSPTTYEVYQEQTYPIELTGVSSEIYGTTDFDLSKITVDDVAYETLIFKNYKDSKYYVSGASENLIYYNEGVYKYVCNADDDWQITDRGDGTYLIELSIPDLYAGSVHHKLRSNYFLDISEKDPNHDTFATAYTSWLNIIIESDYGITTLEDWQDFITNNEVIFYIARAGNNIEDQRVGLIENWPDLAAQCRDLFDNATAYNDATNVTQENDDLPFDLYGKTFKKIS